MLAHTVRFYGAAIDLPNTFFLFLQHVFFRNIPNYFDVAERNIILLYSGASKFIHYIINIQQNLVHK